MRFHRFCVFYSRLSNWCVNFRHSLVYQPQTDARGLAECPRVNGVVCGGNGVCGYDSAINSARCFCYDNWLESDCQTPANPFPGGSVAGATIGGIILGAAVLLGFSYWKRGSAAAPQIKTGEGFY
jgi:hypothetical protein